MPLANRQITEHGKRTLQVSQGILKVAVPATDFTQHRLYPRFAPDITRFTEEGKSLPGMLISLPVMSLLAEEGREFIQRPGHFVTFISFAMQGQTTCETTERLGI